MHRVTPLRVTFSHFINYVYIIHDPASGQAVVVDPSWDLNGITARLEALNADLKAILLTHSHYDHVNLAAPLVHTFSPRVYMSHEEIDYYNFRCPNLTPVHDGEQIRVGSMEITCMLTPGHSFGSMCYLMSDSFFTGDTVFIEGCGMCSFDGGSAESMYESIQRIKRTVPPHVRVYPGHSFGKEPGDPLGHLFNDNLYFQLDQKHHFVSFRMRAHQPKAFDFR